MKTIYAAFAALVLTIAVGAQTTAPKTEKSLFWSSDDPAVEVTLIDRMTNFNLIVVSDRDVRVTYRTEINSMEAVVKELEPVRTVGTRKYFLVKHSFSRRTIWMALDFKVDGKKTDALTRTFYDGLMQVVPNEQFMTIIRR